MILVELIEYNNYHDSSPDLPTEQRSWMREIVHKSYFLEPMEI